MGISWQTPLTIYCIMLAACGLTTVDEASVSDAGSGGNGALETATGGAGDLGTGGAGDLGTGGTADHGTGGTVDHGTGGTVDHGTGGAVDHGTCDKAGGTGGIVFAGPPACGGSGPSRYKQGFEPNPGASCTESTVADVGARCTSDADCGAGFCLSADSGLLDGGGPAGGLCTIDCTNDSSLCGSNSACYRFGSRSFCLERCQWGVNVSKCHGRDEMACALFYYVGDVGIWEKVCIPQCNIDSQCPSDMACDGGASWLGIPGLCQAGQIQGLPIGLACTFMSCPDPCRGYCAPLGDAIDVCVEGCIVGATEQCGWGGPGTGPASAACFGSANKATGDAGYCGSLCDCNKDCVDTYICTPFSSDSNLAEYYQRRGYCYYPSDYRPDIPCK